MKSSVGRERQADGMEVGMERIARFALLIGLGDPEPEGLTPAERAVWEQMVREHKMAKEAGLEWDVPFTM